MAVTKIDAGQFKTKVILKQPASIRNSEGGKETAYVPYPPIRAKVQQNSSLRALEANATALLNTDTVWLRYANGRQNLTENWIANYHNRDHIIQGIEILGDNEFIRLVVKNTSRAVDATDANGIPINSGLDADWWETEEGETRVGGLSAVKLLSLVGRSVLAVARSGSIYNLVNTDPGNLEVRSFPLTGELEFQVPFFAGETVSVILNG